MTLTTDTLRFAIARVQASIGPIGDEMNALDGQLGNGDLSVTLVNGFDNMARASGDLPDDIGIAFMGMAKGMTSASRSSLER